MLELVSYIALTIITLWLTVITVLFLQSRKRLNNLLQHTRRKHIDEILDEMVKAGNMARTDIREIQETVEQLRTDQRTMISRVVTRRFNPFGKSGSEQSFLVMLLDDMKNGVSLNFIYTHEGVRVYAKQVKAGKGVEIDLSAEEQKALDARIH